MFLVYKWFITQCFGVGFRCSHQAGDSVPLPGPPDPPDMAPDPHDEGDFEGPDTCSLMDEFMAKMAQSVNDEYKNLHALLATLPDPSVDTGPVAIILTLFLSYDDFIPSIYQLYSCHMMTSFHLYTNSIFWGR